MDRSRIAILLLVITIALPTGLFQPAPGRDAGRAPALAAASSASTANPAGADAPLFKKAEKHGDKRKADMPRKHDARARKAHDDRGKKPSAPAKGEEKPGRHKPQVESARRELIERRDEMCDGPGMIFLPKSGLCTHGPDPAPPGVDTTRSTPPLPPAAARRAVTAVTCDGNGQSGPRVQVIYAHASDRPNRHSAYLASMRAWAAEADTMMQESAAAVGGARRFRFVTTPDPGCDIDIANVTLSPAGDNNFDNMAVDLATQGFNRGDRKYLVFVDTTSAGICGLGSWWDDDAASQANWNNYGPSYARVDAGCWGANAAAHELMHNLGAVQLSAPNTSGGAHCIDEYDVMCYSDEPFFPRMRYDCPQFANERLFDCGHDDYFHPAPNPGSYLGTHWNAADSRFLVGGGNGGDDDGAPPVVNWVAPTVNDSTHETASGTLALEVTASDGSGINRVDFWRYDANEETWVTLFSDRSAPYTTSFAVSNLDPGFHFFLANAIDGAQQSSTQYITVKRTEPNAAPPLVNWVSPVGNEETHRAASGAVALEVTATDPAGIAVVKFWRFDESDEAWVKLAEDDAAPYRASLPVADLSLGENTVLADGYDVFDNRTTEYILIDRIAPPPPVAITSPQNGATFKPGAAVSIAVAVAEPAGATVEVRSCPGGSCSWAAGTSLGSDGSAPFGVSWTAPASGSVTFLAQVSAGAGPKLSEPVTVSIEETKAKKKKKKR